MRLLSVIVAIGALSQTAIAQTPACKSIADSAARLACYDKAAPPLISAEKSTTARTTSPAKGPAKADGAKYVDSIGDEDARINAQLKNICRGC